ncbi:D-aspartate oxidase-like [Lingula anatina]|uniref:D-aspartate oxidase-like n=1 Tax=Lingula anatina TaxID=7574 RepID=A0A1S3HA28_LINAN|nr:D-aspartate oxidase-like [Lingula anatina]|eukprot:XP_013382950.1 D-aspartate oxidase-like [Lingula anatina]
MAVSGYKLYSKKENVAAYFSQDILYHWKELSPEEMKKMFAPKFKVGFFMSTVLVECQRYLPWLTGRFIRKGGKLVDRKVESLQQFAGRYDVVVNCCGLGARELLADDVIRPLRGQVIRVKAPWIKHFYSTDTDCYIYPGVDTVVLGGVKQLDNFNLEVDPGDKAKIKKNCTELVPSLKDAEFLCDWVGLRPLREPLRLEREDMKFGDRYLKVVHNYGHGQSGVGLSWGTAVEATKLVQEALGPKTVSKL